MPYREMPPDGSGGSRVVSGDQVFRIGSGGAAVAADLAEDKVRVSDEAIEVAEENAVIIWNRLEDAGRGSECLFRFIQGEVKVGVTEPDLGNGRAQFQGEAEACSRIRDIVDRGISISQGRPMISEGRFAEKGLFQKTNLPGPGGGLGEDGRALGSIEVPKTKDGAEGKRKREQQVKNSHEFTGP